jgi:LysR family transcriptional regulator (chromosome initiation inhibitor)
LAGARSLALGAMRYRALASRVFIARHFPDGVMAQQLARVPAIVFGPDDQLQHRYLAGLGVAGGFAHHLCPSSEGFVRLISAGLGWGLVPELQVEPALASGALQEILPGRPLDVPLYWHHWRNGGELMATLTHHLQQAAKTWLVTPAG